MPSEELLAGLHVGCGLRRCTRHGKRQEQTDVRPRAAGVKPAQSERRESSEAHDAEQGVGLQAEPSGTFLKCELVTNRELRFCGSSTTVVTISHESPFGSLVRLMYSVTRAFAL